MNSKLLFGATLAISLLSVGTLAMASDAQPARAVPRGDYAADSRGAIVPPALIRTRADVVADLASDHTNRAQLVGPDANRDYNPAGVQALLAASSLSRADVKADVRQAAADGTLRHSDYDNLPVPAHRASPKAAAATFAQRVKAAFAHVQG